MDLPRQMAGMRERGRGGNTCMGWRGGPGEDQAGRGSGPTNGRQINLLFFFFKYVNLDNFFFFNKRTA